MIIVCRAGSHEAVLLSCTGGAVFRYHPKVVGLAQYFILAYFIRIFRFLEELALLTV
jgi:hypothetical protein